MIAYLIRATSVRLPMRVFFKFSGLFLFALAIVFAGNGVFELQNAGILLTTNLAWLGRGLPWAGSIPTSGHLGARAAAGRCGPRVGRDSTCLRSKRALSQAVQASASPPREAESNDGGVDVRERWAGPIVVVLILGGVIAVLVLNLNLKGRNSTDLSSRQGRTASTGPALVADAGSRDERAVQPAGFREYPIGDEVEKNQMLIAAVWLPPVQMEGMEDPTSSNLIHLEADIHATEGNRNGFAKDEFVPYLVVDYTIVAMDEKADGKPSPRSKAN